MLSEQAEEELRALAALMTEEVEEMAASVGDEALRAIPEPESTDDGVRRLMHEAALANLGTVASLLRYGVRAESIEVPRRSVHFVRLLAQRGVGLAPNLRAWRLALPPTFDWWLRTLDERVEDQATRQELSRWVLRFLFTYVDLVAEQIVDVLLEEEARRQRGGVVAREELARRLLAGEPIDVDDASRGLRWELRRHHVAAIITAAPGRFPRADLVDLERIATGLTKAIGLEPPLVVVVDASTIWIWISSYNRFTPEQVGALERTDVGAEAIAVIGEPAFGLDGFRASHGQAAQALRVALMRRDPPGTATPYRSVALAAVLCADPVAARAFARVELGPLDEDSPSAARHRETVAAYLAEGSYARAARRLGVHEKTVMNRITQVGELLGSPVNDRHAALEAALLIRSLLGSRELDDRGSDGQVPPSAMSS
jgi:DNA-binding PucR family transcriptional regulator